jgi:hypothetical protein
VTDSSTPTAQSATTQPLSVIVNAASGACGSGNESVLKGQYAFSLSGFNSSGYMAALGSFSANGTGGITAGTVDSNGIPLGVQTGSITASASSYLLCGLGQSRLRHHRYTLLHLHHPLRS